MKPQSININEGVSKSNGDIGAGDQGIMFGYAIDSEIISKKEIYLLPLPYVIAADLLTTLNLKVKNGQLNGIYTDNKSQVCCLYEDKSVHIEKIILSSFHDKQININDVRNLLKKEVIEEVLDRYSLYLPKNKIELLINSAGPFWIGGLKVMQDLQEEK